MNYTHKFIRYNGRVSFFVDGYFMGPYIYWPATRSVSNYRAEAFSSQHMRPLRTTRIKVDRGTDLYVHGGLIAVVRYGGLHNFIKRDKALAILRAVADRKPLPRHPFVGDYKVYVYNDQIRIGCLRIPITTAKRILARLTQKKERKS